MNKPVQLLLYGAVVVVLYYLLYAYEKDVVEICKRGGWWFLFPVGAAFVISFFHGNFTSLFWDVLGVQAKKKH